MRCQQNSHANPLACDCHLFQLVSCGHCRCLSAVMDLQEELRCMLLTLPAPVGILSLAGRQPLNCSKAREMVLEGHLGDTVTLSCDARLQGVQSWYWVTPGGEVLEESGNGSTLLLANGSLQLRALRPEDAGTYSWWVGGPVLNETLYVELLVHNFTLHGPHDTLNDTTLVGCILNVVLVLTYLYLTPCRCCCCRKMLERLAKMPVGTQAMLIEAVQGVGRDLVQVFVALAPLNPTDTKQLQRSTSKCFRCGCNGHFRSQCCKSRVWCHHCNMGSHAAEACTRRGNRSKSARGRGMNTPFWL